MLTNREHSLAARRTAERLELSDFTRNGQPYLVWVHDRLWIEETFDLPHGIHCFGVLRVADVGRFHDSQAMLGGDRTIPLGCAKFFSEKLHSRSQYNSQTQP